MEPLPDYNELWRAAVEAGGREKIDDPAVVWDRRAETFDRARGEERGASEVSMMTLGPDDTVLDIGAGTGRLAVPMARAARHVTALDPSGKMLAILRNHMEEADLRNYTCMKTRWEDVTPGVDIGPHTVVVAANSLGFVDLKRELKKIDAAATRAVYLFWHAGDWREREEQELWRDVFGAEQGRAGYPDYLVVVHILHDLGIYANVRVYGTETVTHYSPPERAAADWIELHDPPAGKEEVVAEHFRTVLEPDGDGGYVLVKRRKRAMIWWEK